MNHTLTHISEPAYQQLKALAEHLEVSIPQVITLIIKGVI